MRWVYMLALLLFVPCTQAADRTALVLYPEAPPPYQTAFAQMITGLEQSLGTAVPTLALPEQYDLGEIEQWLARHQKTHTMLVALGQRALTVSNQIATELPILIGGINHLPGQGTAPGVSLLIDPALFLETAKKLLPATKTIVVVYHAQRSALIPVIEQAALEQGFTLQPVAVSDASDAVHQISRIFETAAPSSLALWFTRDTLSLNTELLFPFVLEATWQRRIPAFSEILSHTQRGLLFTLYPDYVGIGTELGELIKRPARGKSTGMAFTHAAQLAINTRTAQHLGLSLQTDFLDKADTLFPAW